jgi:hypothetical protein
VTNVGTPGHKDHKATGDTKMKNPFAMRPYMGMIAAMLGMDKQITLPTHLPYVPFTHNTGKRRTRKTRVNRAAWKCNEKRPMSDKTRGHRHDILYSFWEDDDGIFTHRALAKCRRCGKEEIVNVQTKQYTQNKQVLAARAIAAAA